MKFINSKCKILHVGKNNPRFNFFMNGAQLSESEEEKDLWVLVKKSLKNLPACAQRLPEKQTLFYVNLQKIYVHPHLEFCTPAWLPWTKADLNPLEQVKKSAIHMISGLHGESYEEKLNELILLLLKE